MKQLLLTTLATESGIISKGTVVFATQMMNAATGEIYYNCFLKGHRFFTAKESDLGKV